MRSGRYKLEGTIVFTSPPRTSAELAEWLLSTFPPHCYPKYFSRSERLIRRSEYEVANRRTFEEYLERQSFHFFHADKTLIMPQPVQRGFFEVSVFSRSASDASRLILDWLPNLVHEGLYYANAGVPDEFSHRNMVAVPLSDVPGGMGYLNVGKDYQVYVPGLYWLNYLSHPFISRHRLNPVAIRIGLNADVRACGNGYLVIMYSSPDAWCKCRDRVDEFLYANEGFFSKARVDAPASVPARETPSLIRDLGERWP
jgi:hypothetical protein